MTDKQVLIEMFQKANIQVFNFKQFYDRDPNTEQGKRQIIIESEYGDNAVFITFDENDNLKKIEGADI